MVAVRLAFALVLTAAWAATAAAQPVPRLRDGRPDLQGVWTNRSLTTLERRLTVLTDLQWPGAG